MDFVEKLNRLKKLNVVLAHDWLTGFRGGERVLEVFCELFPQAPLYTLIYAKNSTSDIIERRKIVTSFLQNLPNIQNNYRKFLPLFPAAVEMMRIKENSDLMISSSHCVIKGLEKPKSSYHLSYIHSPMRYIYDQFDSYFGPDASLPVRLGGTIFRPYLKRWDLRSNENVDGFIANSSFVSKRIENYYHRTSEIIHPFVELADFEGIQKGPSGKEKYFLMVGAFAPNKRVDLAISAFNQLKLPLKIVGSGQDEKKLRKMAAENIEFLGHLSREEILELMAKAKAFIFPGVEDFGITPLESLAAGTPVIAYKAAGALETLNEDVAIFFDSPVVESLIDAIQEFDNRTFDREALFKRARDFSRQIFIEKIVDKIFKNFN